MATKNQIIEELYKSKEFNDCIGKMEPEHLRDDLRAEVTLILLETEERKLAEIHAAGALKYYAVRIILNFVQSNSSPFYKKYRRNFAEVEVVKPRTEVGTVNVIEEFKGDKRIAIETVNKNGESFTVEIENKAYDHNYISLPIESMYSSILSIEVQSLLRSKINSINKGVAAGKRIEVSEQYFEQLRKALNDEIDFYRSMIILIDGNGKKNTLNKEINQLSLGFGTLHEAERDYEFLCNNVESVINNLYWYDKEILQMYIKLGNYRAIEKKTGIPYSSAYKTVQKVIKEIKEKVAI